MDTVEKSTSVGVLLTYLSHQSTKFNVKKVIEKRNSKYYNNRRLEIDTCTSTNHYTFGTEEVGKEVGNRLGLHVKLVSISLTLTKLQYNNYVSM